MTPKRKNQSIRLLLLLTLTSACSGDIAVGEVDKNREDPPVQPIPTDSIQNPTGTSHAVRENAAAVKFPLDTILGEKILDTESKTLRQDNFRSLLKLTKHQLLAGSSLYDLKQLDDRHFLMSQKKNYADARNFNLLIKTDDLSITGYRVFNDYLVSDLKPDSGNWILLL